MGLLRNRDCHGFSQATGTGWQFCNCRKPVPVPWVHGFDEISNSARNRPTVPAHHAFLSATMCQPPPQPPKSRPRIAKDGKWVVHLPISQEGKSLFPFYSDFDLILKL